MISTHESMAKYYNFARPVSRSKSWKMKKEMEESGIHIPAQEWR